MSKQGHLWGNYNIIKQYYFESSLLHNVLLLKYTKRYYITVKILKSDLVYFNNKIIKRCAISWIFKIIFNIARYNNEIIKQVK